MITGTHHLSLDHPHIASSSISHQNYGNGYPKMAPEDFRRSQSDRTDDIETDSVPVNDWQDPVQDKLIGNSRFYEDKLLDVNMAESGLPAIPSTRLWQKTFVKANGDLEFLKSVWNDVPSKPRSLPRSLPSGLSSKCDPNTTKDSDLDGDAEVFHNNFLKGNNSDFPNDYYADHYRRWHGNADTDSKGDNSDRPRVTGNRFTDAGKGGWNYSTTGDNSLDFRFKGNNSFPENSDVRKKDGFSGTMSNSHNQMDIGVGPESENIGLFESLRAPPNKPLPQRPEKPRAPKPIGKHTPVKPPRAGDGKRTNASQGFANDDEFNMYFEQEFGQDLSADFPSSLDPHTLSASGLNDNFDESAWTNSPVHYGREGREQSLPDNDTNFMFDVPNHGHAAKDKSDGHFGESSNFQSSQHWQYGGQDMVNHANDRSFEAEANIPWEMGMHQQGSLRRGQRSERGGNNSESNPFMNTFSEEISYGDNREQIRSELPHRGSPILPGESATSSHDNHGPLAKSLAPPTRKTRTTMQSPSALLLGKGCGHCSSCRETKMVHNMEELASSAGFEIHDVLPDGNCMFRAIVDQLRMCGDLTITATKLRRDMVRYLRENPCSEDGTPMQMFLPTEKWEDYLARMEKDGEWGDEIALRGISEVTKRRIGIISAIGDQHNQITIQPGGVTTEPSDSLYLGHIDDYHYISLRPKNWEETWFVRARQRTKKTKTDPFSDDSIRVTGMDAPHVAPGCVDEYFENDAAIDSVSSTPIVHLSYVLKNVLNRKYLTPSDHQVLEDNLQTMNSHPQSQTKAIATGSIVERLDVSVFDSSPVQIGYALRKNTNLEAKTSSIPKMLVIYKYYMVMKSVEECSAPHDLVMDTRNVHAGYLRLVPGSNGLLKRMGTMSGDVLSPSGYLLKSYFDAKNVIGHARFVNEAMDSMSISYAVECSFWPPGTSEWLSRERLSGWPKPELIESAIESGCLIVPIAHPKSLNSEVEFRFSFAKAEKMFARRNLTKSQRYCFYIFKVLVDFHTRQTPCLRTYFLKTVFFYASEVVPRAQWRLSRGAAVLYLLDQLLQCLRQKNLPHYFIPDNNMIDHFHDDELQRLITHLEAVRQYPIMGVTLLAESHGLRSSWMADAVIEDIPVFMEHRDVHKSFSEVFIPTTLRNAINYIKYMKFYPAIEVIMTAYEDMNSFVEENPESSVEWEVNSLFEFLHQVLPELHFFQQFYLCMFLDLEQKTRTTSMLTRGMSGKVLKDILGNDEPGPLDNILVPDCVVHHMCHQKTSGQEEDVDPELAFLENLCMHLMHIPNYQLSSHYLRASVQLTKRKIADMKARQTSPEHTDTDNLSNTSGGESMSGVDLTRLSTLNFSLYTLLVQLFSSYQYNRESEMFQEYIADLQDVCEIVATPYAFKNLSRIWFKLGSMEMYRKAAAREEELYGVYGMDMGDAFK